MNSNQDMWDEGMTPKVCYTLFLSTKVYVDWPDGFPLV